MREGRGDRGTRGNMPFGGVREGGGGGDRTEATGVREGGGKGGRRG